VSTPPAPARFRSRDPAGPSTGRVAAVARDTLHAVAGGQLAQLPISLRFWDGSQLDAGSAPGDGHPPPTVTVRRRALAHVLREPGELGLSRGWVDGSLTTDDDLERVIALRARLQGVTLTRAERLRIAAAVLRAAGPRVLRRPPVPATEARLSGARHSLGRDRASVRHHYDVSNDFYRLLLGPSLVYSCAYFTDPAERLEVAQERKLDLICRKLDLRAGERLLDIGCGWGSLLIHAAGRYGVHAIGVTLSEAQAALARERAAGLGRRVEVHVADYRELGATRCDKLASVGMYEHVGRAELPRYARAARELLRPGGLMLNHGIARLDRRASDEKSFVARYVFPNGELHPVAELISALQSSGLEVRDLEALREHYPLTLRRWRANLGSRRAEAEALVGVERTRIWDLYLAGAARAFDDAEIGVYQVLATRPGRSHGLPLTRTFPRNA
jgi:cyclopropane-fatty-acyl-phospholipid synthase